MDLHLKDKTVVVTGGSKGIGYAIAKEFLKEGAVVFISGRNKDDLDKAVSELKEFGKITGVVTDNSNKSDVDNLAKIAAAEKNRIDVWVNNVGKNKKPDGDFYTEEQLDDLISVCFKSTVFGTQAAIPFMNDGGSIVNISSLAARNATCGRSNIYASMKAAILAYTSTCAGQFASRKIRVNAVLPGYTRTPLVEAGFSAESLKKLVQGNTVHRMAEPEEIAKPVVFLASDAASFINAEALEVSAGHNKVLNPEFSWENQ